MSIDPSEIRVGDTERNLALNDLSQHFVNGVLDITEFEERTNAAAVAQVRGDLDKLFLDLPDLNHATEKPLPNAPAQLTAEKELDNLMERGKKVRLADNIIGSLMMLFFFLGLFVFNWGYFWIVFPLAFAAGMVVRWIYRVDDDDEKLYKKLQKTNTQERIKRIQQAAERRKELGH